MKPVIVQLENVSVRFRDHSTSSKGLKDTVTRFLAKPSWQNKVATPSTEFWGLRHLDLRLEQGTRLGIIGKNGAGKSTLLKVISRVYRPTEGKLSVKGRIAPLIEIGAGFNPELTGIENIYLNGSILGISNKEIKKRLDSIIAFAELEEFIDVPVKYYSTGMSLRLAFTMATEVTPNVLILDELYAGGDASFIARANKRLRSYVDQSQVLITVAHDLQYIREFCNRVIVLDHGKIIADGPTEEMCQKYVHFCEGESHVFQA